MTRWRQCVNVSEPSHKEAEDGLVSDSSVAESFTNAIIIAGGGVQNEDSSFETLSHSQIAYSLRVYYDLLNYIADESGAKLVEGTVLSLARLDARNVIFVKCFAEQET